MAIRTADSFGVGYGGTGTAVIADVLSGKTFSSVAGSNLGGTMPIRGAVNITPGPNPQAIVAGNHNGAGTVFGVPVPAANVLTGTTIAGTAGTMPNRGAPTIAPGVNAQGITAGYYSGGQVNGDPNLTAANILAGTTIFGVLGNVSQLKHALATVGFGTSGAQATGSIGGLPFTPVLIIVCVSGVTIGASNWDSVTTNLVWTSDGTNYAHQPSVMVSGHEGSNLNAASINFYMTVSVSGGSATMTLNDGGSGSIFRVANFNAQVNLFG